MKKAFLFFLLISPLLVFCQSITITGKVTNKQGEPIESVAVTSGEYGTITSITGFYRLRLKAMDAITLSFKHVGYLPVTNSFKNIKDSLIVFDIALETKVEKIGEIEIRDRSNTAEQVVTINPETAQQISSAQNGIEAVLMTLPGVNNANELSTQYNVRGGNFDENLVYINGIEVYKPFLIRSGQQEGLSVVNKDLVHNIRFSAGGFQARYGDKMSSVLDITYRQPKKFKTSLSASLLGGSLSFEGSSKNNKFQGITGIRYRDNSLFIDNKDTEVNSNPNFTDIQSYLTWQASKKINYSFLGYLSVNNYNFIPKSQQTNFGTPSQPKQVNIYYNGREKDVFETYFGALQLNYLHSKDLNFQITGNIYHSIEKENYDIASAYLIETFDIDGSSVNLKGIGSQLNHARNAIDALIGSIDIKASYEKNGTKLNAGVKAQYEDIRDQINEWEVIDSLGFSVRPPTEIANMQPDTPFVGNLVPYNHINGRNEVNINRLKWYAQYSKKSYWSNHSVWYNAGIRAHNWNVSGPEFETVNKIIYSLRGQFAIKPDWNKDYLFRMAVGMYAQPPSYKELRDPMGTINPEVETQKSVHFILGGETSFKLWNRPFKIESDIYYKDLTNLNAYTVDNVRLRYRADNITDGYAAGFDFRLFGEFVPGTMSWMSIGLLKTEENIDNKGYIARPTDQRFKFALLFQDYIPNIPRVRMYLNLVYNSGLPGGSPTHTDPYDYQYRLNAYKRADIGINYIFKDLNNKSNFSWLKGIDTFSMGIEIFNMFDVRNSISTTWVRDVYTKRYYGIPNYMTPRLFNIKLNLKI